MRCFLVSSIAVLLLSTIGLADPLITYSSVEKRIEANVSSYYDQNVSTTTADLADYREAQDNDGHALVTGDLTSNGSAIGVGLDGYYQYFLTEGLAGGELQVLANFTVSEPVTCKFGWRYSAYSDNSGCILNAFATLSAGTSDLYQFNRAYSNESAYSEGVEFVTLYPGVSYTAKVHLDVLSVDGNGGWSPGDGGGGLGFSFSPLIVGDLNHDGLVNADDVTLQQNSSTAVDINHDSSIDNSDLDYLIHVVLDSEYGDFNLDGAVDFNDFLILQANLGLPGGYAQGDANGDGAVDFNDYLILQTYFGWTR